MKKIYTNFRSPDFLKNSVVGEEFHADGHKYEITYICREDKDVKGFVLITCHRIKKDGTLGVSGFDVSTHQLGLTTLKEFRNLGSLKK